MMHSINPLLKIPLAVSASTFLLSPIIPPNAETGSQLKASSNAFDNCLFSAIPVGLLCLMITAAGSLKSFTRSIAALRSRILLNDNMYSYSLHIII